MHTMLMIRYLAQATLACLLLTAADPLTAQTGPPVAVRVAVRVTADGAPVSGARVRADSAFAYTSSLGIAVVRVTAPAITIHVSRLGFAADSLRLILRAGRDTSVAVVLRDTVASLSSILVTSGGGARAEEVPTRIEVLAGEDVAEKMEMRPADATGFLSEMAGVRVQRTSAATGAAGVRLQGLRPRYTLMLTDGLPLGASGAGLDILQLPPADLRQVEVTKGPATAMHGPRALGGVINLVSKRPRADRPERELLVQQSSQGGSNAYGWLSQAFAGGWGVTTLVGAHSQSLRDRDGDGWGEMPGFDRIEVRPRLFYEGRSGNGVLITVGASNENRRGGFVGGTLAPDGTAYRETFATRRGDIGVIGHALWSGMQWQLRAVRTGERQNKRFGTALEDTRREGAFAELSAQKRVGPHDLLVGTAWDADRNSVTQASSLDYRWATRSLFVQDVWTLPAAFTLTTSGRADAHSRFGTLLSPRVSLLRTLKPGLTVRGSVAEGRSAPSPYVEETHAVGVRNLLGFAGIGPERARYASADVTGHVGPLELNTTLFMAHVASPVEAVPNRSGYVLVNGDTPTTSRGIETFGVFKVDDFLATALYTYTDAREDVAGVVRTAPYAPRHTGGLDLTWEGEDTGTWIALEGFFTGRQTTRDDPYLTHTPSYTVVGLLVAQQMGAARAFVSVENLTNVRQAGASPLVLRNRSFDGRWTTLPWGQLEGRVVSVGVRLSAGGKPHGLSASP